MAASEDDKHIPKSLYHNQSLQVFIKKQSVGQI